MSIQAWLRDRLPRAAYEVLEKVAHARPAHRSWVKQQEATAERRAGLDERVLAILATDLVQQGPLAGTKLSRESSWGADFSTRLLGTYELELHPHIERLLNNETPMIVDVGSADGYYIAGLGRMAPDANLVAYDIDAEARRVTTRLAALNGIEDRLVVRGTCEANDLVSLPAHTVVLLDCEGAEAALITPIVVSTNPQTHFIIECHESVVPGITDRLCRLFQGRDIAVVSQRERLASDAPRLPIDLAIEVLNELRAPGDRWLVVF